MIVMEEKERTDGKTTVEPKGHENVVFIGIKPVMNYVLAVITQANRGSGNVTLKARGQSISRAVDVAEITKNRFLKEMNVQNITIGTERLQGERGEMNVSTIEIVLGKSQ